MTQKANFRYGFSKKNFSKTCSSLTAGLAFVLYLTFPLGENGRSHAFPAPSEEGRTVVAEEQQEEMSRDVLVRENARAWQETLQRIRSSLPADVRQPRAFSDLVSKRGANCEPDEQVTFEGREIPCWLVDAIIQAANETDTDAVYLMALADKESSFRWDAKASTSSAKGLFQFLNATWLELIRDYGAQHNLTVEAEAVETVNGKLTIRDDELRGRVMALRDNPYVAGVMAGEMLKRDTARIGQRVGRDLERTEYYLAHFLGAASASRLIEAKEGRPAVKAAGLFPKAARANRSLFTSRQGRKQRAITVAEFHQRIENMMEQRIELYEEMEKVLVAQADIAQ